MASSHGGSRPGAGRKVGQVSQAKRDLQAMAQEYAALALQTLVDIADKGESEAARVAAANALLDRGYGRPRQALEHSGPEGSPMPSLADFYGGMDPNLYSRGASDR